MPAGLIDKDLGDYLEMIEEIEQGYDDDFSWVDQSFISSLKTFAEEKGYLTDKQKISLRNIYTKGCK